MARSLITPLFDSMPAMVPFVGPEAQERARGRPFRARLGANESIFGPSPHAISAMTKAVLGNWMYSDPENFELREAVAQLHGVTRENVVIGEGIDGLLGCAVRLICEPGDHVVMADGAYPTFAFHVAGQGAALSKVPFRNDREDLDAMVAEAAVRKARILYVSNPNNPMGTWWDAAAIEALMARLPPGIVLLLDEAYSDTAPPGTVPRIDVFNPQVLRLRTFSKAYGLAGARVGYALGESGMIAAFEKVRNHYGINRLGQIGALAAVSDQPYLATIVARIAAARERISAIAAANGLLAIPSAANFVTIDCGRDGAFARRVMDQLLLQDVFVRKPAIAPLDRCIRVSCGRSEDLDILDAELPAALDLVRSAQR